VKNFNSIENTKNAEIIVSRIKSGEIITIGSTYQTPTCGLHIKLNDESATELLACVTNILAKSGMVFE